MWELRDSKLSDLESFDNIGTSFGQKRNKKRKNMGCEFMRHSSLK